MTRKLSGYCELWIIFDILFINYYFSKDLLNFEIF